MANLITVDTSPTSLLKSIPGWDELDRKDQLYIEKETKSLGVALSDYGFSRLAIGEHLNNVQTRLRKGMFAKYLRAYHFKRSTAYKSIKSFQNASAHLPEAVLKMAMARNMPMLGESDDQPLGAYTDHTKRIPPPQSEDPEVISQYLDSIEAAKKRADGRSTKMTEIEEDADVLLKQTYRFISVRLNKLPSRGKARRVWADKLFGMVLSELGVSGSQSFAPEAIPDEFIAVKGRPRTIEAA